jgi:hypothetical protein
MDKYDCQTCYQSLVSKVANRYMPDNVSRQERHVYTLIMTTLRNLPIYHVTKVTNRDILYNSSRKINIMYSVL